MLRGLLSILLFLRSLVLQRRLLLRRWLLIRFLLRWRERLWEILRLLLLMTFSPFNF